MEAYLLSIFNPEGYNPNLFNSIEYLLQSKGRATVRDICGYSNLSQRQMQRLFNQEFGLSIKRMASLVRYQNVWREVVLQEHFNVQKAVGRYGYADCAAAAQNILLGIHGLGLGGVWCGVVSNSDWRKLLIAVLELPSKLEPASVIAFGWPDEEKELCGRWEPGKIHYDNW